MYKRNDYEPPDYIREHYFRELARAEGPHVFEIRSDHDGKIMAILKAESEESALAEYLRSVGTRFADAIEGTVSAFQV